jgi:hypothetical protein
MTAEADDIPELLEEWLSDAMRSYYEEHHAPIPALVTAWHQAAQTVDAQPVVQLYSGGALIQAPVLRHVPVAFPGSILGGLTYPVKEGGFCELVPQEADCSTWFSSGSFGLPPPSERRLSLSDVVAWPLAPRPANAALPSSAIAANGPVLWGSAVYLGGSDATEYIAFRAKVETELSRLYAEIAGHGHPTPSGPTTGYTPPALNPIDPLTWPPSVGSAVVVSK